MPWYEARRDPTRRERGEDTDLPGSGRGVRLLGLYVRANVLSNDWQDPVGLPAVKEEHQAHGRKGPRALAVLGISESEYVTRFTSPAQTDWVMRCTARKVLRVPEQEPIVLPPAKAQRAA